MNILFIGKSCPLKTASEILQKSGKNPGYQIIKFIDLILKGFVKNDYTIKVLSNVSNPNFTFSFSKKEYGNGICYKYLPIIRIPIISQLLHTFYSFFYVLFWGITTKGDKIILCDIFASSSSNGALRAARLLNISTSMILTDMIATPVTTLNSHNSWWWTLFFKFRVKSQYKSITKFNSYVFLTKYMNEAYNTLNKPYIIMEGSVDSSFVSLKDCQKNIPRVVMYAGAIEAEYGFNELVQAFMLLPMQDVELHIYGNGKFVEALLEYQKQDSRIKYMGVVSNDKIVEAEQKATLLVNPRLSNQEFVKYSFPSKTSEYMLSGTPLLTTKLCGIPDEYFDYLYTFEEESITGFCEKLNEILSLSDSELSIKGKEAQYFVLENKNNVIQAKRLTNFFLQIINSKL